MLQVVRELFPYVAAFFLLEALTYLAAAHRLAVAQGGSRFRWKGPGIRVGGLLPRSREFSGHRVIVPMAPDALFLPRARGLAGARRFEPEGFVRLGLEEIEWVGVEQRELTVNGRHAVAFPSGAHALEVAGAIERLRRAAQDSTETRAGAIEAALRAALDVDALRVRWAQAERAVRGVERLGRVLAWAVLGALPAVAYLLPSGGWIGWWVAVCGLLYGALLAVAWRAAGRLRRGAVQPARGVWATALLFPPAAPRLAGALLRHVLHPFDGLAQAAALLPRRTFLDQVRAELHAVDHAERQGDGGWCFYWRCRRQALEELLTAVGASRREVMAAARRRDPSADAYCPLCEGEYRAGVAACEACGIELVSFEPAA